MRYSTLKEEKKLWKRGYRCVACVDEVGRGPLAGAVVVCAVTINSKHEIRNTKQIPNPKFKIQNLKLRDSKKLSAKQRNEFYEILTAHSGVRWGIGIVSEKIIDTINIFQATKLAMQKAVKNLEKKLQEQKYSNSYDRRNRSTIDFLIVDGNSELRFKNIPCKAIVKGDEKVFSCAAASIIAKVTRDKMMLAYHKKYPQYGFDKHKGYGTRFHFQMLKKFGPSKIHRRSFDPLKSEIQISKSETNSKFKYPKF